MGVILHILAVFASITITYAGISEFTENYNVVNPEIQKMPVKLINSDNKLEVRVYESKAEDEIRFYPEDDPKKALLKRHYICGSDLGIKFQKTKSYFCNLRHVSFKIEDSEFYYLMDYTDFPEELKFIRETKTMILITLFFKSKKNKELTLKIPVLRVPLMLASPDKDEELKKWARQYEVGLVPPIEPTKLDDIKKTKQYQLDFNWLSDLLSHGVFPSELASEHGMPKNNVVFSRPIVLPHQLVDQYVSVINMYK